MMRSAVRWKYLARAPKLFWDIVCRGRYDFMFDLMPLHLRRMSATKRANLMAAGMNLIYRRLRPWSWPIHMQVELTNFCNLRCPVCPTGKGILTRKPHLLDPDLFARLMDEVGPYLLTVALWGWGEPLLHPEFPRFVRTARQHDVLPIISTNGQTLNQDRVADGLMQDPPEYLIVAVDGLTDETNSHYRVGARLEPLLAGVRRLAEMKRSLGHDRPILHMRYMLMKHNQHERQDVECFAAEHGFDFLTIRTLSIIDDSEDAHQMFVPNTSEYQAYDYRQGRRIRRSDYICQHAFCFPGFLADGTVIPCDQDSNGSHPYGHFSTEMSFRGLWFSPKARKLRSTIKRFPKQLSFCYNCPYADRKTNTCSVELANLQE